MYKVDRQSKSEHRISQKHASAFAPDALSFALFRFCRPLFRRLTVENLPGFLSLILILVLFSPISKVFMEYGFEGWLWALFGMCQRLWLDRDRVKEASQRSDLTISQKRIIAGAIAAINFSVHETADFSLNSSQSLVLIALVAAAFAGLSVFRRGPSGVQVPGIGASILTIIGRRTLEIYALQIIIFEFIWHVIIH